MSSWQSSFKRILDKAGLVVHRRRVRVEQPARIQTRVKAERPNQVWTIDFKGWWYTRNRVRFEPLTIRDDFSRYVLCAQALDNARTETVRLGMEPVFARYGLPSVIRSDNGAPFAGSTHQADSRLKPSGEFTQPGQRATYVLNLICYPCPD